MSEPVRTPKRRPGSGRRPIPADRYLEIWSVVVEMIKAGNSIREIQRQHGTCPETVRKICRHMGEKGIPIPPKPLQVKVPRSKVAPLPPTPRPGMTAAERLQKHPVVASLLRDGKTKNQAAAMAGVSVNTARVVWRALLAQERAEG